MKKFIKVVQTGAIAFLVGAPLYLANQGDLGVNLTTILATATPTTVLIVTGLYDLIQVVLPKLVAITIWKQLETAVGKDNAEIVKSTVNEIGAPKFVEVVNSLLVDFKEMKDTVLAIKEKQDDVV